MSDLTDVNQLPIIAVLGLILLLAAAAAGRVLGDARRERAANEAATARARLADAVAPPAPRVGRDIEGATFIFHCVSCHRRVTVPLVQLAGGLWRPIRCHACSPNAAEERTS